MKQIILKTKVILKIQLTIIYAFKVISICCICRVEMPYNGVLLCIFPVWRVPKTTSRFDDSQEVSGDSQGLAYSCAPGTTRYSGRMQSKISKVRKSGGNQAQASRAFSQ